MDTHEGTGILPKAACSRHPALAPSQFQRARLPESSLKLVFAAFVIPRDERAMFTLPPLPLLTGCSRVPTIPQVHYSHDDVAVFARFCYWLGGGFRSYFRRIRARAHPLRAGPAVCLQRL